MYEYDFASEIAQARADDEAEEAADRAAAAAADAAIGIYLTLDFHIDDFRNSYLNEQFLDHYDDHPDSLYPLYTFTQSLDGIEVFDNFEMFLPEYCAERTTAKYIDFPSIDLWAQTDEEYYAIYLYRHDDFTEEDFMTVNELQDVQEQCDGIYDYSVNIYQSINILTVFGGDEYFIGACEEFSRFSPYQEMLLYIPVPRHTPIMTRSHASGEKDLPDDSEYYNNEEEDDYDGDDDDDNDEGYDDDDEEDDYDWDEDNYDWDNDRFKY